MKTTVLSCRCGKPLHITKNEGKWVLGCFTCMQSPLISHVDANRVLEKFLEVCDLKGATEAGMSLRDWFATPYDTCYTLWCYSP